MAIAVCGEHTWCIDLLPELRHVPAHEVDRMFDDWHFGPKMNRRVAASIKRKVVDAAFN
jgi:hypothetical protein